MVAKKKTSSSYFRRKKEEEETPKPKTTTTVAKSIVENLTGKNSSIKKEMRVAPSNPSRKGLGYTELPEGWLPAKD